MSNRPVPYARTGSNLAAVAATVALLVSAPALAQDGGGWRVIERISVASDGTQANGESGLGNITPDGRYATFWSRADNLVPGDTNGARDVFVRDRLTGQTTRISITSDGTQGNGDTLSGLISDDGRFVAFPSEATNLVPEDTNGVRDVFIHDRQTGQTTRVSVASDGTQGNRSCFAPFDLTPDGRFVAFTSAASNLVPGDTNGTDAFVHDRQTGQTTRVSVASDGTQGNAASTAGDLSADGRFVTFFSLAGTLVEGDTNGVADVFLHDRQTGQTTRVSVASDGAQANAGSGVGLQIISRDGRFITFPSLAGNLVEGDTNGAWDVFVHDPRTGQTTRINVASDGSQSSGDLIGPPYSSINGEGRLVAFRSEAADLVEGDSNGIRDCFVHDRRTGQTSRVSVAANGSQSDGDCEFVRIGATGRFALLFSHATNLVPGDTNGVRDVLLAERRLSPAEALQELIDTVGGMGLPQGTATSLTAKLDSALRRLTDDDPSNDAAACGTLAAFVNEVQAQESAVRLSPDQAATLMEAAQAIRTSLGCS